jgi:hypothetical protein
MTTRILPCLLSAAALELGSGASITIEAAVRDARAATPP